MISVVCFHGSLSVSPGFSVFVSVLVSVRRTCISVFCLSLCVPYRMCMWVCTSVRLRSCFSRPPEQPNGNLSHAPLSPKVYPECKNLTHLIMLSPTHWARGEGDRKRDARNRPERRAEKRWKIKDNEAAKRWERVWHVRRSERELWHTHNILTSATLMRVGHDKSSLRSVNLCMRLPLVLGGRELGRQSIGDLSACQSQHR